MLAIMSDEITGSICKAAWLQCLGMKADEHDLGAGERGGGLGNKGTLLCPWPMAQVETEILLPTAASTVWNN